MKGVNENTEGMYFLKVNTKSNLQSCPPALHGLRSTSEAIDLRDMPSVRSPQECRRSGCDGEQKGNSCQSQPNLPTILWKEWKRMGKGRCYVTSYVLLYKLHASWRLGQTGPTLIIQASHHWRGASCPSHHLCTWYSGLTYPSRALKWA